MSKRVLIFVIATVLALSSVGLVGAQSSTELRALTLADITLYANPSETSEAVVDVPGDTVVTVVGLDQSGNWAQVQVRRGTGYTQVSNLLILDVPALAETALANSEDPEGVALRSSPSPEAEIAATVPSGSQVSVLAVAESWALIQAADGSLGWVFESALPAGASGGVVNLSDNPELGVFAAPQAGADLVTTVPNGGSVLVFADAGEQWVEIETEGGERGFVFADKVLVLPDRYVQVQVDQASGGVYAEPSFTADLIADLENGATVYYMGEVDDFWAEVFDAAFGSGYVLNENIGTPYYAVNLMEIPADAELGVVTGESLDLLSAAASAEAEVVTSLSAGQGIYVYGDPVDGFVEAMTVDGGFSGFVAQDAAFSTVNYRVDAQPVSAPTGVQVAMLLSGNNPEVGLFAEGQAGSSLVTSVPGGTLVYVISEPVNNWAFVKLLDGETAGWVLSSALSPDLAQSAVYASPDFGAEVVANLSQGTTVYYVDAVDDNWIEIYDPAFGVGYAPAVNFTNPYTTGTITLPNSIVRAGPNDNLYNAIAQLRAGTEVVAKGRTENGAWIQVTIPFAELDYGYYGVSGWISSALIDVDASQLAVTG